MRILILGGDGMLGHQLVKHFRPSHDVRVTLRQGLSAYVGHDLFHREDAYPDVDVRYAEPLLSVLADFRPEAIINAVGIVKQRSDAHDAIASIEINALLPHRLAVMCTAIGARLVHVSTDCVFSGKEGNYLDDHFSDAEDLYGKSKYLGEVHEANAITLRTSIIGRELQRKTGLLEWFLAQQGSIKGYTNAIFSGFTTIELSRIVKTILLRHPHASGVYNVSAEPISKHDLLQLIKRKAGLSTEIVADGAFHCDRSLDSARFRREFDYTPPSWEAMVDELIKTF